MYTSFISAELFSGCIRQPSCLDFSGKRNPRSFATKASRSVPERKLSRSRSLHSLDKFQASPESSSLKCPQCGSAIFLASKPLRVGSRPTSAPSRTHRATLLVRVQLVARSIGRITCRLRLNRFTQSRRSSGSPERPQSPTRSTTQVVFSSGK
ncbi:hypothetical protein ES703_119245 [subsurface metagenome]